MRREGTLGIRTDTRRGCPDRIPRIAHFVFGFADHRQHEPFHLVHYLAVESCRQVLEPQRILFHYKHLPFGVYWDLIRPYLELVRVDDVPEVVAADYSEGFAPEHYRYAHHADFVRLDALIEHGGVYADIDTLFLRPLPDELFEGPFVVGEEVPTAHDRTGRIEPSVCNALLLSAPNATFAREWRRRMPEALDGTWNNHSCHLPRILVDEMPDQVRLLPASAFFPVAPTRDGLRSLLESNDLDVGGSYSVHLYGHLWWDAGRTDFTGVHAGMLTSEYIRAIDTAFTRLARPFLPDVELW